MNAGDDTKTDRRHLFVQSGFSVIHTVTSSPFPLHSHSEYVISHYFGGRARCRIGKIGLIEFRPGDTALLNPGDVHQDFFSGEPRDYLMVSMKKDFLRDLVRDVGRPRGLPLFPSPKLRRDRRLKRVFETLAEEVDGHEFGRQVLIDSLISELAIRLVRRFTPSQAKLQDYKLEQEKFRYQVRRALEYIQDNFMQHLDLDELAAAAELSKFHLDRVFKEATGLSPHTYMLLLRVESAKELLVNSSKPIAEIAVALGFSHQSHLTNVFKKFTGLTPRSYRLSSK